MTKFESLKKELFNLLLVKYSSESNQVVAAAYAVDGYISYYRNASEEDKLVCIAQDIQDVKKRIV